MSITLHPYVENIAEVLATYNRIRVYRDTDPEGAFSQLAATITLVADQENYSATDSSGTAAHWYRNTYYDTVSGSESQPSPPYRSTGLTLQTLAIAAATKAGFGFEGVCTAEGTVAYLLDEELRDQGTDAKFLEAAWILRPDADDTDRVRRVKVDGFDPDTGALYPVRPWNSPPETEETYHAFLAFPPVRQRGASYSWADAVSDGLHMVTFEDEINLGPGDGVTRRFDLATHLGYLSREDLFSVLTRWTDDDGVNHDRDESKYGRFWEPVTNGRASLAIQLSRAPSDEETVILIARRRYDRLYQPSDVTECPFDLARAAAVFKAFAQLELQQPKKYQGEVAQAWAEYVAACEGMPANVVRGAG